MTTYVFVPGGGWGGFIWRPVAIRLRAANHEVFTPTLTGVGERVHLASPLINLDTHIQDIVGVLEYEDLDRVILVGHSYGGLVITGVAERVPQRLAHLIYLDAVVPHDGQSGLDLLEPEFGARLLEVVKTQGGDWWIPPPPDAPSRMTGQPLQTLTQPLAISNPAATALTRTYILCTKPAIENNRQFAARAQADGWRYRELPTGHMAMVTMPDALVEILLDAG